LVPFHIVRGTGIIFGKEAYAFPMRIIFIDNPVLFFTAAVTLWIVFINRRKISFSTLGWAAASAIYFILGFNSHRFWYIANPLFFIFFASVLNDHTNSWREGVSIKTKRLLSLYCIACFLFYPMIFQVVMNTLANDAMVERHYEKIASFIKKEIPKGERIYHANGSDSSYLFYFNRDNEYIIMCDPIYMFYRYPQEYRAYFDLREGRVPEPYGILRDVFGARYGYTRIENPLYIQIKRDITHFKIIYEDKLGILFEILA
jgi:hypothetical protein